MSKVLWKEDGTGLGGVVQLYCALSLIDCAKLSGAKLSGMACRMHQYVKCKVRSTVFHNATEFVGWPGAGGDCQRQEVKVQNLRRTRVANHKKFRTSPKVGRDRPDDLLHPAQLGRGHLAAGSPLLTSPNWAIAPNFGRSSNFLWFATQAIIGEWKQ